MFKNPVPPSIMNSQSHGVPPLTLECHSQGFTGRDQILTEDGTTIMFYYDHHTGFGGWDGELKAGGPEGPVVCRAKKGFTSSFKVQLPNGSPEFDCVRTGMMSVTHEFTSPVSGVHYKWKNVGIPGQGSELALTDLSGPEQRIIATWDQRVTWSRKNGILRISRDYSHELEIICTTALAMYALERARRNRT